MSLREKRDRGRIKLKPVALPDRRHPRTARPLLCEQWRQLPEVVLEAGRRNELQQPGILVAGIPERVWHSPRLENQVAWAGVKDLFAKLYADPSAQDVGVLILNAKTLPALDAIVSNGLLANLDRLTDILVRPFKARGKRAERIRLAGRAAIDFGFWRLLEPMGDKEAADLGARLVEAAAGPASRSRNDAQQ